jgi:hypothetical protein
VNIPFAELGLPAAAETIFVTASQSLGRFRYRYGIVTPMVAFRVARMMHFGNSARSELWQQTYRTVVDNFFGGASFYRRDGRVRPVEVRLNAEKPFADGDTARIAEFRQGDNWIPWRVNVRMDGIDTPESNPSGKLDRQVQYVSRYLGEEHRVPKKDMAALSDLVRARIVYLGKIAGAVSAGFGESFADIGIRLGPAYTLRATEADLCDTLDPWDKYGRIIGRILAGRDNEGEDLLAGFIEATLPGVMSKAEAEYLAAYRKKLAPHRELLATWKAKKHALYHILSLETAPRPRKIFDADECKRIAELWRTFCTENSLAANDLQTMLSFIGLAPPYPKYRGDMTKIDLMAEAYAFGTAAGLTRGHGLTSDTMFVYVRPNAHEEDPYHSPVYLKYGKEMSDVKDLTELDPPDCSEQFGCTRPG